MLKGAYLPAGIFLGLLFCLTGCGTDPRVSRETEYLGAGGAVYAKPYSGTYPLPTFDTISYWDGDGVGGKPSVKIRLGEQRAYFFRGGQLVGVSLLSTGREGFNTPHGNFSIIQKDKDHVSSRFGDYVDANGNIIQKDVDRDKDPMPPGARYDGAKMPYFMRIVSGTGLHAGFLPGYPASHGCIRMPEHMAEIFFGHVAVGTPVQITE
ncbi:MAG: L,D-transpeptidase family protein [Verrucomicrobiota bacterium]|nr:L,D-transpeptidase family protein [Verrucomicrobiota bacterium]